jgi:hypothetical protein
MGLAISPTPTPSAIARANATRLPTLAAAIGAPARISAAVISSVKEARGHYAVQHDQGAAPFVAHHLERRLGRPKVERRRRNRDQNQPGRAHRDLRFGFGVRRAVDDNKVGVARPVFDPLGSPPTRQCSKAVADCIFPEPCPPDADPGGETALPVDVERRNPRSLPRPDDR